MAVSFEQFADELRAFDGRKEIVNEMRREFRQGVPPLRKRIRANALAMLPASGGLGAWVARAAVTIRFRDAGRDAGFKVKVSRKAGDGDKADLDALDKSGRIRHPLYGNRSRWFGQTVASSFFTKAWDAADWRDRAEQAMDRATAKIRGGG
jgi:hypothetical protein